MRPLARPEHPHQLLQTTAGPIRRLGARPHSRSARRRAQREGLHRRGGRASNAPAGASKNNGEMPGDHVLDCRLNALADPGVIAALRPSSTQAVPAECRPGPSHNDRTGTRRPGCRDVLPEPSVGSSTVESKRARSTVPTRRWTVPECARIPAWGIAPMCRSGTLAPLGVGVRYRATQTVSATRPEGSVERGSTTLASAADPLLTVGDGGQNIRAIGAFLTNDFNEDRARGRLVITGAGLRYRSWLIAHEAMNRSPLRWAVSSSSWRSEWAGSLRRRRPRC